MRIEYSLTLEDFIAFQRHACRTSPAARGVRRKVFIAGAAVSLLAVFLAGFRLPVPVLLTMLAGGLAIYTVLTLALTKLTEWWGMRALSKSTSLLGVVGAHTMTLESAQLIDSCEVNENRYRWQGIERIERTAGYLIFWLNATLAHIVPLRAFASPADAEAFEAAARRLREAGAEAAAPGATGTA
jgi:hypothetical protein